MSVFDLYPSLPNHQYTTEFTWAYELQKAAESTTLLRNRPREDLTPEQNEQRRQLLEINIGILIKARDRALDDFCASWIAFRAAQQK